MAENRVRRDRLSDAAIEVLASQGGRGLTHRTVDRTAGLPEGTAKNYFPTRDSLLQAAAERCVERYWSELRQAELHTVDQLLVLLRRLMDRALTVNRSRVLAYIELHAEASRNPRIQQTLARLTRADLDLHLAAHQAAGLPATRESAAVVTLAINSALTYLLTQPPDVLASYGLDDLDRFLSRLISTVYPHRPR
ncbi:TetR/AcrR family transcriptional regulator [Thermostaphylospora chromogena]|uniref:DNA-binding transcriptional regulator YbjK n=1 Tax=Thermostaphylospora chromogena TaxID=35622 RepID=A0A1H1BWG3_9ACTN|nr:TetR family transcriptional regulator [Thermostaphylospora chromogena]SDQ56282.1 DNA-binding transcriptional regulator YbjK [Thermostaphylospora chromogena]